jgi:hypothetical protein
MAARMPRVSLLASVTVAAVAAFAVACGGASGHMPTNSDLVADTTIGAHRCKVGQSAAMTFGDCGREKTVRHDFGDGHAPAILQKLEDRIDAIVETSRWM